ncbi:MAG: peptidoglycan-binding protein [Bacteroidales bacterium]|nr:peptidoglycan-binding protein [Bacteroidales bacterium]
MAVTKNILKIAADSGGSSSGSGAGGGGASSVLQYGSSGADVRKLQEMLLSLGYKVGAADGIFGAQTQAAVLQFQRDMGIGADGIVGNQTWSSLNTADPSSKTPTVETKPATTASKTSGTPSTLGVKPTPVAYDDGTNVKPTTTAPTTSGVPNTMGVNPTPVAFDDGTNVKPTITPTPSPGYGETVASLGTLPNAAVEKNQQYSGRDIDTKPVTPSPSPGYGETVASLGTLPNAAVEKNQMSGVQNTQPTAPTPTGGYTPSAPPSYQPSYQPTAPSYQVNISENSQSGTGNVPPAAQNPETGGNAPAAGTDPVDPTFEAYKTAVEAITNAGGGVPTGASINDDLWALYQKIVDRDPFRYDINEDMLYQQYAQQYTDKGRLAMEDTMGQAAALTGGYGSTYAQSVGQQTYDSYLQRLNEVIPELYDRRYQAWLDDGTRLQQQFSMLGDLADRQARAEETAYQHELDKRDYELKLSEIEREQGNLDRDYGLREQQAQWNQENTLWEQDYKDRSLAFDQENSQWEHNYKDRALAQDAYFSGLSHQLKQQQLFYDQANADRNYELSVQKLLADIESGQKGKSVDIADDPYQVIADTITGLKNAGARDGAEAYQLLVAQGMKDDQAQAYANMFDSWDYDPALEAERTNPNVTDPALNKNMNPIGRDDKISFDYDPNEGIYTLNGNRFNSFKVFLDYLESIPMTDSQYNALVRSAKSYGIILQGT